MSDQQYVDMCHAYDSLKHDYESLKNGYRQVIDDNTQLREAMQKLAMTKRDAYAMAAMTAFLSHSLSLEKWWTQSAIATESVKMANAMMEVV